MDRNEDRSEEPFGFEAYEDETGRADLRHSISVILPLQIVPNRVVSSLSPDAIYEYAFGEEFEHERNLIANLVADFVDDAFAEIPAFNEVSTDPRPYHVGPRSQAFPIWLLSLYHDIRPLLDDAATFWAVGEAARAILSRLKEFMHKNDLGDLQGGSPMIFSEAILTALCFSHHYETYKPKKKVRIASFVRYDFPGYGDADHPGGSERYTISMKHGRYIYIYEITNRAEVINHYLITEGNIQMLTIPNFGENGYELPAPEEAPVRQVDVDLD